ncbi:hypothetical protein BRADI_2g42633v3, partial [Brachypodium distachyon]
EHPQQLVYMLFRRYKAKKGSPPARPYGCLNVDIVYILLHDVHISTAERRRPNRPRSLPPPPRNFPPQPFQPRSPALPWRGRRRLASSVRREMDEDQSFPDMLSFGASQQPRCSPLGEQEVPTTQECSAAVKAKFTKGKNWSSDEDKMYIDLKK